MLYFISYKSRDISVGIALGYGLDDESSKIRFPAGTGNFLFTRTALGPTQPSIQWVPGVGLVANHSTPSSAKVKNAWNYISTPLNISS
jgi:hypothetical protein